MGKLSDALLSKIGGLILTARIGDPSCIVRDVLLDTGLIRQLTSALGVHVAHVTDARETGTSRVDVAQEMALATAVLAKNHVALSEANQFEGIGVEVHWDSMP